MTRDWDPATTYKRILADVAKEGNTTALEVSASTLGRLAAVTFKRLQLLNERIKEIEDRGVSYRGTWQAADEYTRGNLVTHRGSVWHCNLDTRDAPGTSKAWTLAVKAGRDAT